MAASPSPTTTTSSTTSSSTTTTTTAAAEVSETSPVVYALHTPDGVTVRYTILAPADDEVVQRIEAFHDGVKETRPLRMILAEVDNQSSEVFQVGDVTVTQGDGDKVHFIEAWLHAGRWHQYVHGKTESPFYMEGFDLTNDLLARGLVQPGTVSKTVLAAEEVMTSVRSVAARDRSGELVALTKEG